MLLTPFFEKLLPEKIISNQAFISKNKNALEDLIIKIFQQTATAIQENRYKQFDALVKNFGCQISSLQVARAISSPHLKREAEEIDRLIREKSLPKNFGPSSQFLQLARFRVLTIINDNKLDPTGNEVPFTNLERLATISTLSKTKLNEIVFGLQVEESRNAALFIAEEANAISDTELRKPLLQRLLSPIFQRTSHLITSIPLSYNTEAVMIRFNGLVLLKNKLFLLDKPIEGTSKETVFIQMPQQRILEFQEVENLPIEEPLIVIEGFIAKEKSIRELVQNVGVRTLLNANCALIPQYISGCEQNLGDDEAVADLSVYASRKDINDVFVVDHIFCSSVKEER